MSRISMGIIIGNRGFFADELCLNGRRELLNALKGSGVNPVILNVDEGVYGSVLTIEDAIKCGKLFKENKEDIKGIIISLPNFGDEKSITRALRESELNVPILVHGFDDQLDKLNYENRRDAFCGKISVCNNLRQYGYKYSLTEKHTVSPDSHSFKEDLTKFIGICKVVDKIKGSRIGVIGTRPADFNTVRYSEKLLERNQISVEPIGLIDIVGQIEELTIDERVVASNLNLIKDYMDTKSVPEESLLKMANLLTVYQNWVEEKKLDAIAVQCWDSIQKYLGINPCTVMSIFSNNGLPSACESDVAGALSMLALQVASEKPSALVDWNNNFDTDPDKCIIFHCGNFAKDMYSCGSDSCPSINYPVILASTLGKENTYGAIEGNIASGPMTFSRITTDDTEGIIRAYLAEGEVTEDRLDTFGSWGVVKVNKLQELMKYICLNGFETSCSC